MRYYAQDPLLFRSLFPIGRSVNRSGFGSLRDSRRSRRLGDYGSRLLSLFLAGRSAAFDQLKQYLACTIPDAGLGQVQDPRISALTILVADAEILEKGPDQSRIVKKPNGATASRQIVGTLLAKSNQLLGKRPRFLGLCRSSYDTTMTEKLGNHVSEHSLAVAGGTAKSTSAF